MSMLTSDGLSLLVGDGADSESFNPLSGATITKLTITQRLADSTAIGSDAWNVGSSITQQRAIIDGTALATDEAAAQHIRSLALSGAAGNFKLATSPTQTWMFSAYTTSYQEITQGGALKRCIYRLESSGPLTLA